MTGKHVSDITSRFRKDYALYLLLAPFVLWYFLFQYKPMYGLIVAFQEYNLFKGIKGSPFVGWENFEVFFKSPYFLRNLTNTALISLYSLIFAFPAPIILALLLNEVRKLWFTKIIQTMTYMPHFISIVIVAGLVTNFLAPTNGFINILIEKMGGDKIYFLTIPEYFRTIFISMGIWKEVGFGAIIYIAALSGVNPELYEAATMDGANKLKRMWHISIPGILPTIVIMLLLRISNFLEVGHEAIILLYQPSTYATADVLSTYTYRAGLVQGKYDLATAVGLFNNTVGLVLVFLSNKISKKLTGNGLW